MKAAKFIENRLAQGKTAGSITKPILGIATSAVTIGILVMLIAVSTGVGLQDAIKDKVSIFSGHIQLKAYADNASYQSLPISIDQPFLDDGSELPEYVSHVQSFGNKAGILKSKTDFEGVLLKGLGADYKMEMLQPFLLRGEIPNHSDSLNKKLLVSEYLANRLQIDVDDKVAIYFMEGGKSARVRTFKVAAIYKTGIEFFDQKVVMSNLSLVSKLLRWEDDEVGGFEVILKDYNRLMEADEFFHTNASLDVQSRSVVQMYPQLFQWIGLFDLNMVVILVIMILVAAINMITALLIMMIERSPMIGSLKALGASNNLIRKIFIRSGLRLLIKGILIGNGLGLLFLFLQWKYKFIGLDEATYYVSSVPVAFPWFLFLLVNLGTILITLLMLWLPSRYVSNIDPLKAIKFE